MQFINKTERKISEEENMLENAKISMEFTKVNMLERRNYNAI